MFPIRLPRTGCRRWLWGCVLLVLVGFAGMAAAWGWSAYHWQAAQRAADAQELKDAQRHVERARLTWPLAAENHLLAARLARRLGQLEIALDHLDAHERCGGDSAARFLERELAAIQDGDLAGRDKEMFALVQEKHPDTSLILEALARGCLKENHPGKLFHVLELWNEQNPGSAWRGRVNYHVGRYAAAAADLAPFVARDPEWDEIRFELAMAHYYTGRTAESLLHLEFLQRRDSTATDVLLGLGMCLHDQARLDDAAAALDSLLEQDANHPRGLVERARVAFRQGQPQQGERWARRLVEQHPAASDGYLVLAFCLEAQGRSAEARVQRQRWQALDAAHYHLTLIQPDLARYPTEANLHYQAGSIFLTLEQLEAARESLEHALRLDPQHRPTHRLLADYFIRQGQPELAREHQKQATAP